MERREPRDEAVSFCVNLSWDPTPNNGREQVTRAAGLPRARALHSIAGKGLLRMPRRESAEWFPFSVNGVGTRASGDE